MVNCNLVNIIKIFKMYVIKYKWLKKSKIKSDGRNQQ